MKIRGFLKRMNFVRINTVGITLFVVFTLTSSSLISTTLNNISKKEFSNLEENEPSIGFEPSAGLAPNVAVNNSDIPRVSLPFGAIMRGYIVNSSIYDEGLCHFEVDNPEDIIYLNNTESDDFLSGGTGGSDGYWYACENSTGALWEIDPDNGDMTYIGGGGIGLNGLAHDITTNLMYGASGSGLYMVDVETGEQEFIGYFGNDVIEMIGIAVDYEGNMYGWDLGDKLWYIDEQTGEATEIGPLGIDLNYAQDGGFYWNDDILFLTAFTMSPNYGSYLYACDQETGECSLIGQLEGNSQITASVVSLGWCCYCHDIGVEDIISPKDGNAWGEVEVIVKVKNYGDLPEEDVPINVVILKDGAEEEYNETVYVDIDWEETLYVEMPVWTPDDWQGVSNEYIDYMVVANADLYGDENPDNDYMEKWIELYFGYYHDVGCTNVIGPKSGPAQTFPVKVTIKNFGQYNECCFKTYVEISELDPEYVEYKCTTTIKPGEEKEIVFDDWTPDFLQYETTGNKDYTVKVWTDMFNPPDENPDNDLFTKFIKLNYYHDVRVKEIISPFQSGSGIHKKWWYAVTSNYFVRWCPWTGEMEYIGPIGTVSFPQGGTFVEDEWWICDSTGNIYIVDTETGNTTFVGNSGTGELVSLAYNIKDKTLYGMSTSTFYEIDLATGQGSLIGSLGVSSLMISCAANSEGVMYSYDLGFGTANTYTIDLETGKATVVGPTGVYLNYGQDMAYDFQTDKMYAAVFNYGTFSAELHEIDMETGAFTYIAGPLIGQTTCFAIPYTNLLFPEGYVPLGSHDIEVIVENIGTFPELDLACYAEIYEYITNCTNGTIVYENNITDIDLDEPLGGNKTLKFDSYNFTTEGFYGLFINITDDNDDYPNNNEVILGIGADDTPPVSNHTLDPETPDGENDWYVDDLEVILYAKDPSIGCNLTGSGVKEIKYTIDGVGGTIPGNWGIFTITEDGNDVEVEYWAIDWVENVESKNSFTIDMDQTKPNVNVIWDAYRKGLNWYVKFTCEADDETSGMGQVEMYIDNELHETITGPGPTYEFDIKWLDEFNTSNFKFVAIDKAGNSAFSLIDGADIKSYSYSKIYTHQSIKIWAQMWLDRFILINKFFRWLI